MLCIAGWHAASCAASLEQLCDKCARCFTDGVSAFESVSDLVNMALLHSNRGKLMRLHAQSIPSRLSDAKKREFTSAEKHYFLQVMKMLTVNNMYACFFVIIEIVNIIKVAEDYCRFSVGFTCIFLYFHTASQCCFLYPFLSRFVVIIFAECVVFSCMLEVLYIIGSQYVNDNTNIGNNSNNNNMYFLPGSRVLQDSSRTAVQ